MLLLAHVVYCVCRVCDNLSSPHSALGYKTIQSWNLLLAKGVERKAEWRME